MGNLDNNMEELRSKIELFLDNALDPSDQEQLREFVNNNPEVNKLFKTEHSFRQFVKNNIMRPKLTNEFIDNLKNNIHFRQ